MCTFMVNETISCYVNNGSTVHVLLLDATKAFDIVDYCLLFQKLTDKGMCSLVVRRLLHMHTNQKLQVRWNYVMSNRFNVQNGVHQGGVMSPLLFGVYMDGLLDKIKHLGIGCYIGQHFCGAADDIILLCPNSLMAQKSKYLHFEIKGMDVSTCEKTIHLVNVLPLWHDSVNKMCIKWRNALRQIWKVQYGSHRDFIKLIAECVSLDVALVFRFIKFLQKSSLVRQHGC